MAFTRKLPNLLYYESSSETDSAPWTVTVSVKFHKMQCAAEITAREGLFRNNKKSILIINVNKNNIVQHVKESSY